MWFSRKHAGVYAHQREIGVLLFCVALSPSVRQLKPEILVCKMAALMINVAAEWQRQKRGQKSGDRKELLSLSMLIKAIFIQCFLFCAKEGQGGGGLQCCGTTFVMLNPILNLPVLIGHHKHPFTKQDCEGGGGSGVGAGVRWVDKASQGAPKWPTLDKTKASFTEPAQTA